MNNPIASLILHGVDPFWYQTFRAIRQHPLFPVIIIVVEAASQFNTIDIETLQHVLVNDRQLLRHVVHFGGAFGQAQVITQAGIGHRLDAAGAVRPKINGDPVRLLVV
jgi:hypothetical protein